MPCACDRENAVQCLFHLNLDEQIIKDAIREDEENDDNGDCNEE